MAAAGPASISVVAVTVVPSALTAAFFIAVAAASRSGTIAFSPGRLLVFKSAACSAAFVASVLRPSSSTGAARLAAAASSKESLSVSFAVLPRSPVMVPVRAAMSAV